MMTLRLDSRMRSRVLDALGLLRRSLAYQNDQANEQSYRFVRITQRYIRRYLHAKLASGSLLCILLPFSFVIELAKYGQICPCQICGAQRSTPLHDAVLINIFCNCLPQHLLDYHRCKKGQHLIPRKNY